MKLFNFKMSIPLINLSENKVRFVVLKDSEDFLRNYIKDACFVCGGLSYMRKTKVYLKVANFDDLQLDSFLYFGHYPFRQFKDFSAFVFNPEPFVKFVSVSTVVSVLDSLSFNYECDGKGIYIKVN